MAAVPPQAFIRRPKFHRSFYGDHLGGLDAKYMVSTSLLSEKAVDKGTSLLLMVPIMYFSDVWKRRQIFDVFKDRYRRPVFWTGSGHGKEAKYKAHRPG